MKYKKIITITTLLIVGALSASYLAYANFIVDPASTNYLKAGSLSQGLVGHWSLAKEDTRTGTTNKVTNGTFDTDTAWVKGTDINILGGTANWGGSVEGLTSIYQEVVTIGETYIVEYTVSNYVSGEVRVAVGTGTGNGIFRTANGTYTQVLTGTGNSRFYVTGNNYFQGSIDNVTVYDVTGNVVDLTPNSNAGTMIGTTWTTDRHGTANKAISINNAGAAIAIPMTLPSSTYSITAWVKQPSASSNGYVFDFRDSGGTGYAYFAQTTNAFTVSSGNKYIDNVLNNNVTVDDTWHFVAITGITLESTANLYIGNRPTLTNALISSMEDFRIYEGTLTTDQLTKLYQTYNPKLSAGSLQKNLAGYWSLDKNDTRTGTTNKVVNGDFAVSTGWTFDAGVSYNAVNQNVDYNLVALNGSARREDSGLVVGETYQTKFTISNYSTGTAFVRIGVSEKTLTARSANGTYIENFTYEGTGSSPNRVEVRGTNFIGTVDDFEIYDVTGNVVDLTPNNNQGLRIGTTWTTDRHGQANKALSFNGTSNYVDLSSSDFISDFGSDTKGSISLWVNPSQTTNDVAFWVSRGDTGASDELYIITSSQKFKLIMFNSLGTQIIDLESNAQFTIGNWYNIVITQDGTTSKIYVNGVLQTDTDSGEWFATLSGLNAMHIGVGTRSSSKLSHWDGSISDVRYYSGRALSQTEVTRLYNSYK
jgi:hypothetical protein